jgi:Dolichyl-phosphate-mannose-protein mannosyltransferase
MAQRRRRLVFADAMPGFDSSELSDDISSAAPAVEPAAVEPAERGAFTWPAVLTIAGIALAGMIVRLLALFPFGGAERFPVDYDEGVYSAAAQLLAHGEMPYRDFVFVHPPGVLYAQLPLGLLSPDGAFAAGRLLMVAVGGACIVLIGLLALRRWGLLAGALGAAVYACYPEVVQAEHGVFLEPLINLFALAALACWLKADDRRRSASWDGRAIAAGALAAAACTMKLSAATAVLALLLVPPAVEPLRKYKAFLVGLLVTGLLLWLPVFVAAPTQMLDQILVFQFVRPPDGAGTTERLGLIFADPSGVLQARHLAATVLALAGLVVVIGWRRRERLARIAAIWFVLTVAAFLLSASYFDQYNAGLAPSASLLAAAAVSYVAPAWRRGGTPRAVAAVLMVGVLLLTAVSLRRSILETRTRNDDLSAVAADITTSVPNGECVISFEPAWLLAADRLPPTNNLFSADPYAAQLMLVLRQPGAADPASTVTAFAEQPLDGGVLDALGACRFLVMGPRAQWQLSAEQLAWVAEHYRRLPQTGPIDLWERIAE